MSSEPNWLQLIRRYIALRDHGELRRAIELAPALLTRWLTAIDEGDGDEAARHWKDIEGSDLRQQPEWLTLSLLQLDLFARICWEQMKSPSRDPEHNWEELYRDFTAFALDAAVALDDVPCQAFFNAVHAEALYSLNALHESRAFSETSIRHYETLYQSDPRLFAEPLARRHWWLAECHYRLRELRSARAVLTRALDVLQKTGSDGFGKLLGDCWNSIGLVLRDLNELDDARDALSRAVSERRRLIGMAGAPARGDLAEATHNLATVCAQLGERAAAMVLFQEALDAFRALDDGKAHDYRPHIASTLSNIGRLSNEALESSQAQLSGRQAVEMYRGLAADGDPESSHGLGVVLTQTATALMMSGLSRPSDMHEARRLLEEALAVYENVKIITPQLLQSKSATLHNLGVACEQLHDIEAARRALTAALEYRLARGLALAAAQSASCLGQLEHRQGHGERAAVLFLQALTNLEHGLTELSAAEQGRRDTYKRTVDEAATALIQYYAASDSEEARRRLPGLFESLRQLDVIADVREGSGTTSEWAATLELLERGHGRLSRRLLAMRAVFVWMHATRGTIVFGIVAPGRRLKIVNGGADWAITCEKQGQLLNAQVAALVSGVSPGAPIEDFDAQMQALGRAAFDGLPTENAVAATVQRVPNLVRLIL